MLASLSEASDALLVAWLIEGDEDSLAELMTRYGAALCGMLRRITQDWEDVGQETWMQVVRHAARYDPTYAFSTWLFRIAWNLALSRRRKLLAWASPEALPETAADDCHPEAHAIAKERRVAVREGIQELPPRLAEAVLLRHFEDLTEREMAHRLGIPAGTVKSRLHHAHRRLAELLEGL